MKLAVIDLGTNSVRFDVHEILSPTERNVIYREKKMVRLGDGAFKNGRLGPTPISRTLRAFKRFHRIIRQLEVDRVLAYATSAMRDSSNAKFVINQIKKLTAIEIKIISGKKEAQYTAKAVIKNEKISSNLFCLIDIGGGSTEVVMGYKNNIIKNYSFQLGANRLHQLFLKSSPPIGIKGSMDSVNQLRSHIIHVLKRGIPDHKIPKVSQFIGSSGTIRAFRRLLKKRDEKIEPFNREALTHLIEEMIPLKKMKLLKIPGMTEKRVDLILAGGILLEELMKYLGALSIYTTDYCLRDGILENELEKFKLTDQ